MLSFLFGATGYPAAPAVGMGSVLLVTMKAAFMVLYRLQHAVVEIMYIVLTVLPGACSRSTPVCVMGNNKTRAGG